MEREQTKGKLKTSLWLKFKLDKITLIVFERVVFVQEDEPESFRPVGVSMADGIVVNEKAVKGELREFIWDNFYF